jgi:hypothetical protein
MDGKADAIMIAKTRSESALIFTTMNVYMLTAIRRNAHARR